MTDNGVVVLGGVGVGILAGVLPVLVCVAAPLWSAAVDHAAADAVALSSIAAAFSAGMFFF